ncbi:hypothetical protein EON76_00380 [bacterium]|nr:MAG: hypothetical protein EON76_00380 [bacterium]
MLQKTSRLLSLDYLRGFFIIVIIIDHLYRFPNLYAAITGEGRLWVTAAEGFVIISGLLIGYVRGYKNKSLPLLEVSKKVWKRAILLYTWLVGATLVYTILIWYIPTAGSTVWEPIPVGDWRELLTGTFTMSATHVWVYFLHIYAVLLALTPIVLWMLRHNNVIGVIASSIGGYALGRLLDIEWMQWMPLFYIPAIAGYYFLFLQQRWHEYKPRQRLLYKRWLFITAGSTLALSIICTFIVASNESAIYLNALFTKEFSFNVARIPLSFLWFVALAMLFEHYKEVIGRYMGWLLLPFGTRSLTAYIIHGAVLFALAYVFVDHQSVWYNTLITTFAIALTWVLVRQKIIQRLVPQ